MKQKARKIISVITASLLLLTTGFITARTTVAQAEDVVLQQYGNEWSSYPYGDGNIGNSGCGAMAIVNSVRYLTGNTMDIYALADWASANEYIWGVGSSFTIAPNAAAKFGSQYGFQLDTHYGYSSYVGNCYPGSEEAYDAAWDMLVTKLSKGETAVGLVHNHFISIVDYDSATDRVLVYDPGAGSKRETTKSGDWKTYDELNYWSEEGTTYLKLRGYLTFYFATGTSSGSSSSSSTTTAAAEFDGDSEAAGTYTVVTNGTGLNMRSQPTTASTILMKIPEGAEVQVIESNGSWASVTYDGISGYCSMDYLVPAEETETTATSATTTAVTTTTAATSTEALSEEYAGEYIVSAGGSYLNMREGRGTSYSIVAQIPDGSSVTVTAADESWAAVTWDGNSGYCSMDYLVKASETTTVTTAAATTTATTTTTASASETESDTKTSSETTTTETTTTLTTTTTEAVTSETAATTNDLAGAYSVKTDGAHLNLRAAGSLNAEILAQIPNGSELFVISSDGDWSNVSWNGIVGYCKAEYLTRIIIDAEQSAGSIASVNPAYAVLYGDTNLDGEVTMADIVLLHKALTGAITLNRTASANSDCYSDLELNSVDAAVMIQHVSDNCAVPIEPIV